MSAEPYFAPRWLPGGHAQTLWPLLIKPRRPPFRRERWETPDGDFIDADLIDGVAAAPLLVLFHGLEGSSRSHYARSLAQAARRAGWRFVLPHFRGCSGEPNRLPRAYHSGDSAEIGWLLERCKALAGEAPLFAAGVSLGGNALIKWAGEQGARAGNVVQAIAAISAPLDLAACGHHLAEGFNRVYTQHFLGTLKANSEAKLRRHPGIFDAARMRRANNLYQFDDAVTAPLHGFAGADDYWQRASGKPWLRQIEVPALVINARNDPFLPHGYLPTNSEVSAHVRLEQPPGGGHVGFVSGRFPGHLNWLPRRLLLFFSSHLGVPQ